MSTISREAVMKEIESMKKEVKSPSFIMMMLNTIRQTKKENIIMDTFVEEVIKAIKDIESRIESIPQEPTMESLLKEMNIPLAMSNGNTYNGSMGEWIVRTTPYARWEWNTLLEALKSLKEKLNPPKQ